MESLVKLGVSPLFHILRAWLVAASGRAEVSLTKSHAATSDGAGAAVANQLDTHVLERLHDLGQRIHIAAYETVARFHALNGGERQPCTLCQHRLVNSEQGASSAKLRCSYHCLNISIHVLPLIRHVIGVILWRHAVSVGLRIARDHFNT